MLHPLIIYKSFFTDADMLKTMHRDTNANLYPTHTLYRITSFTFFADTPSESGVFPSLIDRTEQERLKNAVCNI